MIRLLIEDRAFTLFLLPLFTAIYVLLNVFFPEYNSSNEFDLGLFGTYLWNSSLTRQMIGGTVVFLNAIGINYIFNHYNFYEKTTYFPAFIYIVWMSFFEGMYNLDGFVISHIACILMILQLFKLNQNEDGRKIVFNAAFFAGLATCLHLTNVVILPFLFLMVWIARPFVLRESLLLLAGFITPLLYAGVLILFQNDSLQQDWELDTNNLWLDRAGIMIISTAALLFIILSVFGIRNKLQKSSIRFRKLTRILWMFFFMSLSIGLLDLLLLAQMDSFSLVFVVVPIFSFFSFLKKPLSVIASGLFFLVMICSFLKFFL